MKYDLFTFIPEDSREAYIHQYKATKYLRAYMVKYLQREVDKEVKNMEASINYESPAWAAKQADSNGYRRALRELIAVLGGEEVVKELED